MAILAINIKHSVCTFTAFIRVSVVFVTMVRLPCGFFIGHQECSTILCDFLRSGLAFDKLISVKLTGGYGNEGIADRFPFRGGQKIAFRIQITYHVGIKYGF